MLFNKNLIKALVIVFLIAAFLGQLTPADARDRDRGRDGFYYTPHYLPHGRFVHDLPRGYLRLFVGGLEYYYWEGMFYEWSRDRYVVVPAPYGAFVTTVPAGSQPVIVDGVAYYSINGATYMQTPYGYEIVPQPRTIVVKEYTAEQKPAANTASNAEESFTVNVPNSKGGYTPVTLRRSGNGFIGPQGEFYTEFPRIEQLKTMYAK